MSRTRDDSDITDKELDIGESDLALDPDGLLDEGDEPEDDPDAVEKTKVTTIERETLQSEDPAEDDLPDRAFDRMVPGV